jgi:hypothetical protein
VEKRFVVGDEVDESLARFLALEASGWKGARGTALSADPALIVFYTTLTRRLAARGWLEWHSLVVDGQLIAGHLAVRFGRAMVVTKIAYDEGFARCAPGNLLFDALIERTFAEGELVEINCLTDMPWHRNWRMSQSHYIRLWLFPQRPIALAFGYLPRQVNILARRYLRPAILRLRARRDAWKSRRAAG